nr:MAG TPA: hypothetical protein [Caudoviricetes sp.]
MNCKYAMWKHVVVIDNLDVIKNWFVLSELWRKHSYAIAGIDNLGSGSAGRRQNVHVHIRYAILMPYVIYLIAKHLN